MRVAGTALVAHGRGCHSTQATLQMVRPSVRLLVKLEASARKAPSVQVDPMNLCLAHPVTIAIGINLTRSLECVQLDIIAMEARSIVTQSTKPLVIGVQRAITVQLKVPIQHHAYQVLMLIQNTTSSRTTVNLVSPACSAQLMDLTIQPEIVLKDSTVLLERHNRVLQTKNVSLVTSVLKAVGYTTHVLLERISLIPGKVFVTSVLLEVTVILMKLGRTCHVKEVVRVESLTLLIAPRDTSALMALSGPSNIHVQ